MDQFSDCLVNVSMVDDRICADFRNTRMSSCSPFCLGQKRFYLLITEDMILQLLLSQTGIENLIFMVMN